MSTSGSSGIVSPPGEGTSGSRKFGKRAGDVLVSGFKISAKPVKAVGSILNDFKNFISRGNVVDLAVGIVMGAAFTAVVDSLVKDIVTPVIAYPMRVNFEQAFVILRCPLNGTCVNYNTIAQAQAAGAITWNYGMFFNNIVKFLLTSIVIFFIVKAYAATLRPKVKPVSTKECPYCCKADVPMKATRCPHCTSTLPLSSPTDPIESDEAEDASTVGSHKE